MQERSCCCAVVAHVKSWTDGRAGTCIIDMSLTHRVTGRLEPRGSGQARSPWAVVPSISIAACAPPVCLLSSRAGERYDHLGNPHLIRVAGAASRYEVRPGLWRCRPARPKKTDAEAKSSDTDLREVRVGVGGSVGGVVHGDDARSQVGALGGPAVSGIAVRRQARAVALQPAARRSRRRRIPPRR